MRKKESASERERKRVQSRDGRVAKSIKQARQALGLSRRDLAKLVGVDVTTVTGWENGKFKPRDGAHRAKLASALDMDIRELGGDRRQADSSAIQVVDVLRDLPLLLEANARRAKASIKDIRVAAPYLIPANVQVGFRTVASQRILDGSLEVLRVEIFYSLDRLREVLSNILRYHGHRYYVRSYCAGVEEVVPAFGGYAFDDGTVVFGGYHVSVPPHDRPGLMLRGPAVKQFFRSYWDEIWRRGTALNLSGSSDLSAVRALAKRLGLRDADWPDFLAQARTYECADGAPPRI